MSLRDPKAPRGMLLPDNANGKIGRHVARQAGIHAAYQELLAKQPCRRMHYHRHETCEAQSAPVLTVHLLPRGTTTR